MERFEATPLRVINEVGHAWGVRIGTRLQYDLCSHVYSHYPSTAKGSLLPPPLAQVLLQVPRENNRHAEAVSLLSSWLRANHFNTNKEHISERISDTQYIYIYIYTHIHIYIYYIYIYTYTYIYTIYTYIYIHI